MDIASILSGIKGKVLDAAHFDLLKSAYELQGNNIEQMKDNNSALSESHTLLREKADRLTKENERLMARVAELEAQLASASPELHASGLPEAALAILKLCLDTDITDFYVDRIPSAVGHSRMQVESAIDELENRGLIRLASAGMDGANYYLTESGKKYAMGMA